MSPVPATEVGGSQVQSLPGLQSEFKASLIELLRLPQNKKKEKSLDVALWLTLT